MNTEKIIKEVITEVKDLLIEKNRAYGDSAISPSNIFSNGDALDSLGARIDDKLMRIKNTGITDKTEDTLIDLIGYLVLYKVAMIKEKVDEFESEKEILEMGGHVNINGTNIDSVDGLIYHYEEKEKKSRN
tara:strand:- start:38 stop:430 length:393 start_codon:yes stop_codon:yes gene_type:complete